MATERNDARSDLSKHTRILKVFGSEGAGFVVAAVLFFAGSAILTQSGQPGASTPVPWMLIHALWVVAMAFIAIGTVRLVLHTPQLRIGLAGYAASGLVGLGVLHTLQWTTWVYVDVIAYQAGTHGILLPALFHPFGTGHMLMFAIILGSAITTLSWSLMGTTLTHWAIPWIGSLIGISAMFAGIVSLLTFAAVRSPTSLLAIVAIAMNFAWVFVLGVTLDREGTRPGHRAVS